MSKKTENREITILEIYNKNGLTLTELMQVWLNENYFFWNLNNDTTDIKYKSINK